MRLRVAATAFAAAVAGGFASLPADAAGTSGVFEKTGICAAAVKAAERAYDIPEQLLTAISHVESGRWDDAKAVTVAWPWTVNNGGDGKFFPTRAAAIAHVDKLRRRGVRNIDVGCMQVNLKYHPDAFDDLETAFDPQSNAHYAAQFLTALRAKTRSWVTAAAHYHSTRYHFSRPYKYKVLTAWNRARRAASEARREAVRAAYLARREARRAAHAARFATN